MARATHMATLALLMTTTGAAFLDSTSALAPLVPPAPPARPAHEATADQGLCTEPSDLVFPTGDPPSLACDDARRIVQQARSLLATPPLEVDAEHFAEATADWLDPHGLWSAAPDAPTGHIVRDLARSLLEELEAPLGAGACEAASTVGAAMVPWVEHLRAQYAAGLGQGVSERAEARFALVARPPFEDGDLTRPASDLALELGRAAGAFTALSGEVAAPYITTARDRLTPTLDAEGWGEIVLAAAVRAYVPLLDAHGAWAPLDEETSIFDLDLLLQPPPRLWGGMTRTALGVRIDDGALPPLRDGDLVLKVHGTALAGMSVEQADQLGVLTDRGMGLEAEVVVLRKDAPRPVSLTVTTAEESEPTPDDAPLQRTAATERVPYDGGFVLVIGIQDVPDDLGLQLADILHDATDTPGLRGVVLDLRGNGGGSTDGAIDALSLFVPDAAMFPMRRRDGGIEIDRTPSREVGDRYDGPLAVLIDGGSASAAEMIASAIQAYRRGVVIGARSYGKGCAQEYLDDATETGVLRLTTLLFAAPDGAPVQKVGVRPDLALSLPEPEEREALVPHALEPWRGPDVRDRGAIRPVFWSRHAGHVGPCADEIVCRALRAVGSAPAAAR